jgi:diguanylate cyclase (GGDEF)-like protein
MLNPFSILVVTVLASLMAVAMLGSLRPAAIAGLGVWITASLVSLVALPLFALQGHAPRLLSIVAANVLLAFGLLLVLDGCYRFFGIGRRPWAGYAGLLLVAAGIVWWTYGAPDFDARVALVSAFHAGLYLWIAALTLRCRPQARTLYSYYFVAIAALLLCAGHLARGLMYGLGIVDQGDLLQVNAVNIAFIGLGVLAPPAVSTGLVMLAHDRLAQRLERLANIDDLTGALARRAFLHKAQTLLDAAARARTPVAFAVIDIDRFKLINDAYGHAAGDAVLVRFAAFVARNLRAGDVFGRLGGEEFGVLCPETSAAGAAALLERLRVALASAGGSAAASAAVGEAGWSASAGADAADLTGVADLAGVAEAADAINGADDEAVDRAARPCRYTFSVGVDEYRHGEPLSALMARADRALYAAKAAGRDRVIRAT